mmetsp:Transcript_36865/g.113833  ORF Transcript_36865/g.113833 Transcript_36865/m.113833 type:complete len:215 (+) Transcript_36865:109-753(+)
MTHCIAVMVPIMNSRTASPRHSPLQPISRATSHSDCRLFAFWLRRLTSESAGCDTTAQQTPARKPAAMEMTSWVDLGSDALGTVTMRVYVSSMIFSKDANLTMVYGTCRDHSGTRPLKKPAKPSPYHTRGTITASTGGKTRVVCIFTLMASHGASRMSANTSAHADAVRNKATRCSRAKSGPTTAAYWNLKYSYRPNLAAPWKLYPMSVGPHPR